MGKQNLIGEKRFSPSEKKDPFKNENIESVKFFFYKRRSFIREDKHHVAEVIFINGNTTGKQVFYDDDADDLKDRVSKFIENLD